MEGSSYERFEFFCKESLIHQILYLAKFANFALYEKGGKYWFIIDFIKSGAACHISLAEHDLSKKY